MKSILDYLKEIRREVILYDIKVAGWVIYSIVLTLFVLGLILESVFYFSKGWHLKAVYSIIIGFIFASSTIWNYNFMFLQSYAWIIGAFISGFVYYLLANK